MARLYLKLGRPLGYPHHTINQMLDSQCVPLVHSSACNEISSKSSDAYYEVAQGGVVRIR